MTEVQDTVNPALRKQLQKKFRKNNRHIESLTHEMANLLMAEVVLDILEKAPTAKTLKLEHLTEEYNEYNTVVAVALLDEEGKDLFDEDESLEAFVENVLCNYNAEYLIMLPETINVDGQLSVLSH